MYRKQLHDKINYLKQAKVQEEKEVTELENMIQLVRSQLQPANRARRSKSSTVCTR